MYQHWSYLWRTCITDSVATFDPSAMVGDNNETDGGFTAVLTERANGVNASTLTFHPSTACESCWFWWS